MLTLRDCTKNDTQLLHTAVSEKAKHGMTKVLVKPEKCGCYGFKIEGVLDLLPGAGLGLCGPHPYTHTVELCL